jgi:hypothetical protein
MSEIIEDSIEDLLYKKLNESDCGKKVFIPSEDPIGLYNHTIKQFNAVCNKTAEGSFEKLDTNCFYGFWMVRWWTMIRADTSMFFLVISFIFNFLISLIPIVNIAMIVMWLITYLLYEKMQKIHSKNNKNLSTNPFKYMILNNDLCKKANLLNLYYEMPVGSLSSVGLKESQIEILKSKNNGGTVTFMVYSTRFRLAYTKFGFLRIVHILHILVSITGIIIANLLIYPKTEINEFFQTT